MNIYKIICLSLLLSLVTSVPSVAMEGTMMMLRLDDARACQLNTISSLAGMNNEAVLNIIKTENLESLDMFCGSCTVDVDVAATLKRQLLEQQEREKTRREKEGREANRLRKKSAFRWGLFGFLTHLSAGLGIGYVVNTCKSGGSFLKNVLKPMANNFLTKRFLTLGGLYFSKYLFLQGREIFPKAIDPTLNKIDEKFSKILKKVDETLERTDKLVGKNLLAVDGAILKVNVQVEKTLSQVDKVMEKNMKVAGTEISNVVDKVFDKNLSKFRAEIEKGANNVFSGVFWKILSWKNGKK